MMARSEAIFIVQEFEVEENSLEMDFSDSGSVNSCTSSTKEKKIANAPENADNSGNSTGRVLSARGLFEDDGDEDGNLLEMNTSDSDSVIFCGSFTKEKKIANASENADNSGNSTGRVLSARGLFEDDGDEMSKAPDSVYPILLTQLLRENDKMSKAPKSSKNMSKAPESVYPVLLTQALHENDEMSKAPKSSKKMYKAPESVYPVLLTQTLHENDEMSKAPDSVYPVLLSQVLRKNDENSNLDENELEEHPHLVPIKAVATNTSPPVRALILKPQSSVPVRYNWDGMYQFKVSVKYSNMASKSDNAVFSEFLNKLYVAKDIPFKVLVSAENVPINSTIKVTAEFCMVEHGYESVQRCPTHAQQDFKKGVGAYKHFVQCFSDRAIYLNDIETGNLSLLIPYEKPKGGENYTSYLFKLGCFSSCAGGINRRPFMIVFALDKDNIILGRQTIEVKVCACPYRDMKVDEEKERKKTGLADTKTNIKQSASSSCQEQNSSSYQISVSDPEEYQFLRDMKHLYETSVIVAKITRGNPGPT